MSRGVALRRNAAYPDAPIALLEDAITQNQRATADAAYGPFKITDRQTSTYIAKPWEMVRCNPTSAALTILLPDANAANAGAIVVVNDSDSTNTITVKPLNSTCKIIGTTSVSITLARGALTLHPDRISNNWLIASASSYGSISMSGDVTGTTAASTVAKIQGTAVSNTAPTTRQVLVYDGSSWVPTSSVSGLPVVPAVTLTFKTTAGTVDAVGYTVPASPSGTNRFSLHRVRVRLKTAISGTGSVILRAGTSVGGNELLVDSASWTNATAAGTEIGISIADFGTSFPAAKGYVCELDASATVNVRATTTGTLSAGDVEIFTYGALAS